MFLLLPDDVLLQILGELEWATLIAAVRRVRLPFQKAVSISCFTDLQ